MLDSNGAGERNRTSDLLITNQLLYQLSYNGKGTPEPSLTAAWSLKRLCLDNKGDYEVAFIVCLD